MFKTKPPKESRTEKKVKDYGDRRGWMSRKYKSPGQKFVPDQIFMGYGTCFFIEFKRMNEKPTEGQFKEHEKMREKGQRVYVCDNIGEGFKIIDKELYNAQS